MIDKKRLGVDVDEVVVEFFKEYLKHFNHKFGKSMAFDDMKNYRIWDFTDISKEDSLQLAHEIHNSENSQTVVLIEGVEEALNKLNERYEIHFITSRSEKFKEKTLSLLNELFDFDFKLHFSEGVWGESKTKGELCRELGINVMVEDNADYALTCAKAGVKTFLLDKPWNQEYEPNKNLIKVKTWNEILNHLKIEK